MSYLDADDVLAKTIASYQTDRDELVSRLLEVSLALDYASRDIADWKRWRSWTASKVRARYLDRAAKELEGHDETV